LYGENGALCESVLTELMVRAEWNAQISEVGDSDDSERTPAAAVMEGGKLQLVGVLEPACEGALLARSADLAAPAWWTLEDAAAPVRAAVDAAMRAVLGYMYEEMLVDPPFPPEARLLGAQPSDGEGRALGIGVYTGGLNCHEDAFSMGIWDAAALRRQDYQPPLFEDTDRAFEVLLVGDVNGDGDPELITDHGFMTWQGSGGRPAHRARPTRRVAVGRRGDARARARSGSPGRAWPGRRRAARATRCRAARGPASGAGRPRNTSSCRSRRAT